MINKVMILGTLTADPQYKTVGSEGILLASFSVAFNKYTKNKTTGEREQETSFFDCTAFRHTAEFMRQHVFKGDRVMIEGSLRQERWTSTDGHKRNKVSITVDRLVAMKKLPSDVQGPEMTESNEVPAEEIPF